MRNKGRVRAMGYATQGLADANTRGQQMIYMVNTNIFTYVPSHQR